MFKTIITCEHASNFIPEEYLPLFSGEERLISSHRGWDPGARELAETLSDSWDVPLFLGEVSRLLIELNRSLDHPALFSRPFSEPIKEALLCQYYYPYRQGVERIIRDLIQDGDQVFHLSVHTFTPVYERRRRKADVGLLYDPSREDEKLLVLKWREQLKRDLPGFFIGRNTPYRGTSDGFTTYLRREFKDGYLGIELEVNQKHLEDPLVWKELLRNLSKEPTP